MPERSSILQISKVGKTFGRRSGSFEGLRDVDLAISGGEFVSIIGHSGCGKSTLLNLVAGLETPTLGGIFLEGQLVDGPGPERAVVFQNHSLLPWLTVYGNVRLAVDKVFAGRKSSAERDAWARQMLDLVNMSDAAEKRPAEISGGMKQRVGIARALAMEPKVLLLDEPFGALDEIIRNELNEELLKLWARTGKTVCFVTHSIPEAVYLSTKIVVMSPRPGRIAHRFDLPFSRRFCDGQPARKIKASPDFIEIREQVLSIIFADEEAA